MNVNVNLTQVKKKRSTRKTKPKSTTVRPIVIKTNSPSDTPKEDIAAARRKRINALIAERQKILEEKPKTVQNAEPKTASTPTDQKAAMPNSNPNQIQPVVTNNIQTTTKRKGGHPFWTILFFLLFFGGLGYGGYYIIITWFNSEGDQPPVGPTSSPTIPPTNTPSPCPCPCPEPSVEGFDFQILFGIGITLAIVGFLFILISFNFIFKRGPAAYITTITGLSTLCVSFTIIAFSYYGKWLQKVENRPKPLPFNTKMVDGVTPNQYTWILFSEVILIWVMLLSRYIIYRPFEQILMAPVIPVVISVGLLCPVLYLAQITWYDYDTKSSSARATILTSIVPIVFIIFTFMAGVFKFPYLENLFYPVENIFEHEHNRKVKKILDEMKEYDPGAFRSAINLMQRLGFEADPNSGEILAFNGKASEKLGRMRNLIEGLEFLNIVSQRGPFDLFDEVEKTRQYDAFLKDEITLGDPRAFRENVRNTKRYEKIGNKLRGAMGIKRGVRVEGHERTVDYLVQLLGKTDVATLLSDAIGKTVDEKDAEDPAIWTTALSEDLTGGLKKRYNLAAALSLPNKQGFRNNMFMLRALYENPEYHGLAAGVEIGTEFGRSAVFQRILFEGQGTPRVSPKLDTQGNVRRDRNGNEIRDSADDVLDSLVRHLEDENKRLKRQNDYVEDGEVLFEPTKRIDPQELANYITGKGTTEQLKRFIIDLEAPSNKLRGPRKPWPSLNPFKVVKKVKRVKNISSADVREALQTGKNISKMAAKTGVRALKKGAPVAKAIEAKGKKAFEKSQELAKNTVNNVLEKTGIKEKDGEDGINENGNENEREVPTNGNP